jgi:hypothetical protein
MKNDLGPDEKMMIQGFRRLSKPRLAFKPIQKFDLVEVQKAMFKAISYPLYLIFYFWTNRKLDLLELEKDVSRLLLALFTHILPPKNPNTTCAMSGMQWFG